MILFTFAFLAGDLLLQIQPQLPTTVSLMILLSLAILFILINKYVRYSYLLGVLTLGFVWSAWFAWSLMSWQLPKKLEGKSITIEGYVASIPHELPHLTQFLFSIEAMNHASLPKKPLVQLSWYQHSPSLHAGEKWYLCVRLKRIHGLQNPGTFDYEAWALQKGIRAKGSVVGSFKNHMLKAKGKFWLQQIRQNLLKHLQKYLPHSETSPWLIALMLGEHINISAKNWEILRNTGTNHLMAIAGLHIGILAGLTHVMSAFIIKRFPWLLLRIPACVVGNILTLPMALSYSALAGFSLPTKRASIMLAIYICATLSRRKINPWHVWSCALLCVLIENPLSILTQSFWLSFGTLAIIIYTHAGRIKPTGWWWTWGRMQWMIGLGLIPLTLTLFQQCAFISFVANIIAIPWLSFLILPVCFLSLIFIFVAPQFTEKLLYLADFNLNLLWKILSWLAHLNFAIFHLALPNIWLQITTIIAFVLILTPGFKGKCLSLFWLLPLFLFKSPRPYTGQFWMNILDVGQGLAVVIQTKDHTVIYDTGPRFANFDSGEQVLLPFLYQQGIKEIDYLIISHADNDHIGGAFSLIKAIPVKKILTSQTERPHFRQVLPCDAGQSFAFDHVKFTMLYPTHAMLGLGNNSSCVLRIENDQTSALLTGDIEQSAEAFLVQKDTAQLSADILIAPHHGSKTSANKMFIQAVHPRYVIYSVGYQNRYHFPHEQVILRYQHIDARQIRTDEMGMVRFKTLAHGLQTDSYRLLHPRYWLENYLDD